MRVVAILALSGGIAVAAPTKQSSSTTHPGIVHEVWADASVPVVIHVVRIDLTSSEIAMYATRESDKGHSTTYYADHGEAPTVVAINGGPFDVNGFRPRGFAMGGGAQWSQTMDDASTAVLALRRTGEHTVVDIVAPEEVTTTMTLPPGTQGVVSGGALLVRASNAITTFDCNDPIAIPCTRAPRTAVGVGNAGGTLLAVVVDGWQSASHGMSAPELATFIRARGATDAILLDGGSSSELVLDGGVTNAPSDGVERVVANHLGWSYGALAKGELTGAICRDMLSNCTNANDTSKRITGATVTLDDGRAMSSTTTGCPDTPTCATYDFGAVTPRLACVTVSKPGFLTAHKCAQVVPGDPTYNSVVLVAGTDPIDAGVTDDASEELPPDGDIGPGLTDAGTGGGGGGGGCCDAGGDPAIGLLVVLGALGFRRSRHRGTTGNAQ